MSDRNVKTEGPYRLFKHETEDEGNIWGVDFPHPGDEFLSNFSWAVSNEDNSTHPPFCAYFMRITGQGSARKIEMRFHDHSPCPLSKSTHITMLLICPAN